MLKQLRIKFVCINMVIITVILCLVFGILVQKTVSDLEQTSMQMLELASSGGPFRPNRPGGEPMEYRQPFFTVQKGFWGNLMISGSDVFDLTDTDQIHAIYEAAIEAEADRGVLSEYGLRYLRRQTPLGFTVAFADISAEQATVRALLRSCLLTAAVTLLIFLGISILLAQWAIKPVEQAWQQQKQFVADASHELKTPLTVILTNAELLQNPNHEPALRRQFTGNILTMSHQMRGLVENLLELARVDNGVVQKSFTALDLSQLVSDAILPFEPLFFEKEMTLRTRIDPNIRIQGSEQHLRQVVDIFLDNAMKYADPQALVMVGLQQKRHHCLLAVSNAGPPIVQEDLKHIFKRFYRVDSARAMNRSYGLGLPIAEAIVLDHKGKIWAESARGFNTFYVQLPILL